MADGNDGKKPSRRGEGGGGGGLMLLGNVLDEG